jgi:site-specific DNA-methyltransferase (adenine-specific)
VIHDGSDEMMEAFAAHGAVGSDSGNPRASDGTAHGGTAFFGSKATPESRTWETRGGTAPRFYYCAKASKSERAGSKHPTVKPISLMRYLCKLVTSKCGTVLDPFAGTGTTGQAAVEEGFSVILIEREVEYCRHIRRRLDLYMASGDGQEPLTQLMIAEPVLEADPESCRNDSSSCFNGLVEAA